MKQYKIKQQKLPPDRANIQTTTRNNNLYSQFIVTTIAPTRTAHLLETQKRPARGAIIIKSLDKPAIQLK